MNNNLISNPVVTVSPSDTNQILLLLPCWRLLFCVRRVCILHGTFRGDTSAGLGFGVSVAAQNVRLYCEPNELTAQNTLLRVLGGPATQALNHGLTRVTLYRLGVAGVSHSRFVNSKRSGPVFSFSFHS